MIEDAEYIDELFLKISAHITKKCDIFMIGGGALMTYGLKYLTKDIDIIVDTTDSFNAVRNSLRTERFHSKIPELEYGHLNLSDIFIKGEYRIDMFCNVVCGKLSLSEGMKRRAHLYNTYGNVNLYVCSLEDILIFKSITDRDGDLEDCENICLRKIDWKSILDEIREQISDGHGIWITYISERLNKLSEMGHGIPILDSINDMNDEYMESWISEMEKKMESADSEKKSDGA